jgi:uncharacterized protein YutE (UPF0331/DUF86 family)
MARGAGEEEAPGVAVPAPIAQRLSGLAPALRTLQLALGKVSPSDYKDGVHSRDPGKLIEIVYPLERSFEVVSNYITELTGLALKELSTAPVDGIRDLEALAGEGVITKQLAEQLADIHRARNDITHEYPDVRASIIYPACEELSRLVHPFLRSYLRWLREIGYAVPKI